MLNQRSSKRLFGQMLSGLALLLWASRAMADPDPRQGASEHYARGLELANAGGYDAALREFEEAFALSPHYAVLYNIAQSQVALGRPIEAVRALSQYLRDGDQNVPASRRAQVAAQIALLESRLATLSIRSDSVGAHVSIDGREIGRTPLAEPARVAAGTHTIAAGLEGGDLLSRVVTVGEGEKRELNLELPAPRDVRPVSSTSTGTLAVRCDDRTIRVSLDGSTVARERWMRGVSVTPGVHRVGFIAQGKAAPEQNIDVPFGGNVMVFCGAPTLVGSDQAPSSDGSTAAVLGYVAGASGVAFGGAALIHYLWNRNRAQDWQNTQDQLQDTQASHYLDRQIANNELADSIGRASRVTVGLAAVGGALLTTGAIVFLLRRGPGTAQSAGLQMGAADECPTVALGVQWNGVTLEGSW